ncbi:hypothetical protein [Thiolapillus sp.]|uniref:hypothetical protein n=1 Tax=Thiolapillus sp. TaxID=2017437 RepID=UPI003AF891FB
MKNLRLEGVESFDCRVFNRAMQVIEGLSVKDMGWIAEHIPSILMGFEEYRTFFVMAGENECVALCGYSWEGGDRLWWMAIPYDLKASSPVRVARAVCRFLEESKIVSMKCTVLRDDYPEAYRLLVLAGFEPYAYDMATDTTYMERKVWTP